MNSEWLRNEFIGLERRLKVLLAQYSDAQQQLQQLQSENKELQQQLIAEKKEVQSLKNAMNFDALAQLLHQRLIAADKKDTLAADPSSASAVQPLTKANEQAQAATVKANEQAQAATVPPVHKKKAPPSTALLTLLLLLQEKATSNSSAPISRR